jgi:ribosomal 50S subunit-recycling heat shock protein
VLKVKKGDTDVAISDDDKKKDSVVLNLNAEKFKAGDVLEITAGENTVKVNVVKKETEDTKPQE